MSVPHPSAPAILTAARSLPSRAPATPRLRAALLIPIGLALVAAALFLWWPLGVVLGLAFGVVTVLGMGDAQQRAAARVPRDDELAGLLAAASAPAAPAAARPTVAVAEAQVVAPAAATPIAAAHDVAAAPVSATPAAAAPVAPVRTATSAPAAKAVARKPAPRTPVAQAAAAMRGSVRGAAPADRRVRADLDRLKADLGDGYPDFARAARLVVSTQYASAARLQRDLHLPYSRARRLLADLETEHFVGPATGTLPRQVLLPKERLPEVERLFAGV